MSATPPTGTVGVPRHIAIIMDGNGRWAAQRNLPRIRGHEQGSKAAGAAVEACAECGVEYLTLYAFSAENWKRPRLEVNALMTLLEKFLKDKTPEMIEKGVRLQAIGRLHELPVSCQQELERSILATADGTRLTLVLALSYGGRNEILDAVKNILRSVEEGRLDRDALDETLFAQHLYTSQLPDPDLLIRTSGEMRLSNFLLWQLSYTEIVVTEKLWPDFSREDLAKAIEEFGKRHRRYGAV